MNCGTSKKCGRYWADVTADKIFDATLKKLDAKNLHNDSLLKNLRELALKNARLALELMKGGDYQIDDEKN